MSTASNVSEKDKASYHRMGRSQLTLNDLTRQRASTDFKPKLGSIHSHRARSNKWHPFLMLRQAISRSVTSLMWGTAACAPAKRPSFSKFRIRQMQVIF